MGNFSTSVNVGDIHEVFRLRSIKCPLDTCSVGMPMASHVQSKGLTFITASQQVTKELVKLNGVEFQGGNCIVA